MVWGGGAVCRKGHPLKVLGSRNTRFTKGQRRGLLLETVTDPGGLTLSLLGSDNDELKPGSLSSHGKNRQRSWTGGSWFG